MFEVTDVPVVDAASTRRFGFVLVAGGIRDLRRAILWHLLSVRRVVELLPLVPEEREHVFQKFREVVALGLEVLRRDVDLAASLLGVGLLFSPAGDAQKNQHQEILQHAESVERFSSD